MELIDTGAKPPITCEHHPHLEVVACDLTRSKLLCEVCFEKQENTIYSGVAFRVTQQHLRDSEDVVR